MSNRKFHFLAAAVAIILALAYTAEGFIYKDYNLDEFQVATGYLRDTRPGIYPSDFIWSKPAMVRNLHVCVRKVMAITDALSGHRMAEPIDLFLLWLPFAFLLFFTGNYLL